LSLPFVSAPTPRQSNAFDCGVHALLLMDLLVGAEGRHGAGAGAGTGAGTGTGRDDDEDDEKESGTGPVVASATPQAASAYRQEMERVAKGMMQAAVGRGGTG
jgi:hypothetical protein